MRKLSRENRSVQSSTQDKFSSGLVDLVTDRVKNQLFGVLTIVLFPVILLNVFVDITTSSAAIGWDDQIVTSLALMQVPDSMVLGESSSNPLIYLATNKESLPVAGSVIGIQVLMYYPESQYAFCKSLRPSSFDDERLAAVCNPFLAGYKAASNVSGYANFDQFAFVAGVPGTFILNITAYYTENQTDYLGNQVTVELVSTSVTVALRVLKNTNVTLSSLQSAPEVVEYGYSFNGYYRTCSGIAGQSSNCQKTFQETYLPPRVMFNYEGDRLLSNDTRVSLFLVSNFSEIGMHNVTFPLTKHPHAVGSVERMARLSWGTGADVVTKPISDSKIISFDNFVILGSNNPSLFFAFYSCGIFQLWNFKVLVDGAWAVREMLLIPPLDSRGLRPADGERWVGGVAPSSVGSDGVASGDQSYLPQLEISDFPTQVIEGETFTMTVNVISYLYPRSLGKYSFVKDVILFAVAVPTMAVPATSKETFLSKVKYLENGISSPSGSNGATFQSLAFSLDGLEGAYRIRVYAQGQYYVESGDVLVSSSVTNVLFRLPSTFTGQVHGCAPELNSTSNQLYCVSAESYEPVFTLPYLLAYKCKNIFSISQSCEPAPRQSVSVILENRSLPFEYAENGTIRWTGLRTSRIVLQDVQYDVVRDKGRYEFREIRILSLFRHHVNIIFRVGQVEANEKISLTVNTSRLDAAVKFCGYDPVGYISVISSSTNPLPTVSYPGGHMKVTIFASTATGRPASNRFFCLRFFELDWYDTFADEVKKQDDYRIFTSEKNFNPYVTLKNLTFHNSSCFPTDQTGTGSLDFYFDTPQLKFRSGPYAWYVESAENESGKIYQRFGNIFYQKYQWTSRSSSFKCINQQFGVDIPLAKTDSYFIYLRNAWKSPPTEVLATSRWPQPSPPDGFSLFPQRSSYYGSLEARLASVETPYSFWIRIYDGTAISDALLFPARVPVNMYMISAPQSFPSSLQACSTYITTDCFSPNDFSFTATSVTDSYGYAGLQVSSSLKYQGIFRFVVTIGSVGQSGSNFFSQIFEIVFAASLKAAFDCTVAQSLLSSSQALAPALKYYAECPFKNPDASCKWNFSVCDFGHQNIAWKSSTTLPACLPLGTNIRDAISIQIVNDHQESVEEFALDLRTSWSTLPEIHPVQTARSNLAGLTTLSNFTVDYALKGSIALTFHIPPFRSSLQTIPLSNEVLVSASSSISDEILANFLTPPPSVLQVGTAFNPALEVEIKIQRNCFDYAGRLGVGWNPPKLETRFVSAYDNNGTLLLLVNNSVLISSNTSVPVFDPLRGAALATFSNMSIQSGLAGQFKLQVIVHSSKQVLLTSHTINLVTTANALRILDQFPSAISPHVSLPVRVQILSSSGVSLANSFVHAQISPYSSDAQQLRHPTLNASNASAILDRNSSHSSSDADGIARFLLTYQTYTPGLFVAAYSSPGAAREYSSPFRFQSPVAQMGFISNPVISTVFPMVWVWPQIKAYRTHVGFYTYARAGSIFTLPSSMKDVVKGALPSDPGPVIQVLDLWGRGLIGLHFNVTLVDASNNILDVVETAVVGQTLFQDLGLQSPQGTCNVNNQQAACAGLYAFPALGLSADVTTGLYRFRFVCEGLELVQENELYFINKAMSDTTRIDAYMLGTMLTGLMCILLFEINKMDSLILNRNTFKYIQSKKLKKGWTVVITGLMVFLFFIIIEFYTMSSQNKTPPHKPNGILSGSDYISMYASYIIMIAVSISCLYSLYFMFQSRQNFTVKDNDLFVRKLCAPVEIELARRFFIGSVRNLIVSKERVSSSHGFLARLYDRYRYRLGKIRRLGISVWEFLKKMRSFAKATYRRIKYSIPVFNSVYFAWSDMKIGQRILGAMWLSIFVVLSLLGFGLWFSHKLDTWLSQFYGEYMSTVTTLGYVPTDWFTTKWPDQKSLSTLRQVMIIYYGRTSAEGKPFFQLLSNAAAVATWLSTIFSTIAVLIGILDIYRCARAHMQAARLNAFSVEQRSIRPAAASSYIGSQAVLAIFGWFFSFLLWFTVIFSLSWLPISKYLTPVWLPLIILSFVFLLLYILFVRIRMFRNPGIIIENRSQFALVETCLLLLNLAIGSVLSVPRVLCSIVGTTYSWFLLHRSIGRQSLLKLGSEEFEASVYVHHVHNNPLLRSVVERLHVELRNRQTIQHIPSNNIEPEPLKRQLVELQAKRRRQRALVKLLVMVQAVAHADHVDLPSSRKHKMHMSQPA